MIASKARVPERSKGQDLRSCTLCFVGSNPTFCNPHHYNIYYHTAIIKFTFNEKTDNSNQKQKSSGLEDIENYLIGSNPIFCKKKFIKQQSQNFNFMNPTPMNANKTYYHTAITKFQFYENKN